MKTFMSNLNELHMSLNIRRSFDNAYLCQEQDIDKRNCNHAVL